MELQKTWVETETLRFRQYLGVQYRSPKNMRGDNALPMVAVYLLGHKVGNIEEPVLYVNHDCYDYEDNRVERGLPDPFVESLTHNSIIVQIPRLHGQINNRLDKVLSVFDQNNRDRDDEQLLRLDERMYSDDSDMEHILHRLTMAAADADMRHRMDVEDEYFSIIEKRDTEILMRDKRLAEQNTTINKQNTTIKEQNSKINEQNSKINEQNSKINEQNTTVNKQNSKINEMNTTISEQNSKINEQQDLLRMSIQMFLQSGLTLEEVAVKFGKSVDELQQLVK